MEKIPFYLVTGFLGSGKTTLLKSIIASHDKTKKIGVVQNEFAPVGIDGEDLKQGGGDFSLLEINNGSVFCACLLGNFIEALDKFITEQKPDLIILEASGLSDPVNISEVISNGKLVDKVFLAHNYTIIDAANFMKSITKVDRILQQIRIADTVIINKIDKLRDDIQKIRIKVKELNPFAKLVETSFCREKIELKPAFRLELGIAKSKPESAPRPEIDTIVVKLHKGINKDAFSSFMQKWGEKIFRVKGFVKTEQGMLAIQTCFTDIEFEPLTNYHGVSQLIFLGKAINKKEVLEDLRKTYL